jgi:hypothetical protein
MAPPPYFSPSLLQPINTKLAQAATAAAEQIIRTAKKKTQWQLSLTPAPSPTSLPADNTRAQ